MTFSVVDTDEPGGNEMSLIPVPPQPFEATESTRNARVSALAGWIPLPVALLAPLPAMAGHLTLPMARSVSLPPRPAAQEDVGESAVLCLRAGEACIGCPKLTVVSTR